MKRLLLNLSGHPIKVGRNYTVVSVELQVPTEISASKTGADLKNYVAETMMQFLHAPSNTNILGKVQTGRYDVVLPGLTAAAAVILAVLHGISGHFPAILWQIRTEDGFEPILRAQALQPVREQARAGRTFGYALKEMRSD